MQIRIAKSQREDKTAYVAVRAGEMTGFAAVRYDLRSLLPRKADPHIRPGLRFIRLIKGKPLRRYQKAVSLLKGIFLSADRKLSFASDHIMDHKMRLERRPEAVKRFCP